MTFKVVKNPSHPWKSGFWSWVHPLLKVRCSPKPCLASVSF